MCLFAERLGLGKKKLYRICGEKDQLSWFHSQSDKSEHSFWGLHTWFKGYKRLVYKRAKNLQCNCRLLNNILSLCKMLCKQDWPVSYPCRELFKQKMDRQTERKKETKKRRETKKESKKEREKERGGKERHLDSQPIVQRVAHEYMHSYTCIHTQTLMVVTNKHKDNVILNGMFIRTLSFRLHFLSCSAQKDHISEEGGASLACSWLLKLRCIFSWHYAMLLIAMKI